MIKTEIKCKNGGRQAGHAEFHGWRKLGFLLKICEPLCFTKLGINSSSLAGGMRSHSSYERETEEQLTVSMLFSFL